MVWNFPGGPGVKSPADNAGDTDWEEIHTSQGDEAHAPQVLRLCAPEPVSETRDAVTMRSPQAATRE